MAATRFIHGGDSVDYTPAAAVAAGDVVVQGDLVGVAKVDIAADALGALAVTGVFDFPKATGVGTGITAGTILYWDDTNDQATSTATGNKQIGKCVKAAGDDDAAVRVKLSQ